MYHALPHDELLIQRDGDADQIILILEQNNKIFFIRSSKLNPYSYGYWKGLEAGNVAFRLIEISFHFNLIYRQSINSVILGDDYGKLGGSINHTLYTV